MNKKYTLLYVDDERTNLQLFEINFSKEYTILTADSGFKGIEILKANAEVVLVICDMKMPNMNGVEFVRLAKKEFPSVLFYILTGFEITEEIANVLNEKLILEYFHKPFNTKQLKASIQEALDQLKA